MSSTTHSAEFGAASGIANFGLSARIVDDLRTVFSRYPEIDSVLLFGSRANGSHRFNSDIDLAVNAPGMSDTRFAALWVELDDLPIVFKLDVLHVQRLASQSLRTRIAEEGICFWRSNAQTAVGRASVLA